jgi:hypothetical protein
LEKLNRARTCLVESHPGLYNYLQFPTRSFFLHTAHRLSQTHETPIQPWRPWLAPPPLPFRPFELATSAPGPGGSLWPRCGRARRPEGRDGPRRGPRHRWVQGQFLLWRSLGVGLVSGSPWFLVLYNRCSRSLRGCWFSLQISICVGWLGCASFRFPPDLLRGFIRWFLSFMAYPCALAPNPTPSMEWEVGTGGKGSLRVSFLFAFSLSLSKPRPCMEVAGKTNKHDDLSFRW